MPMKEVKESKEGKSEQGLPRRKFLKITGTIIVSMGMGSGIYYCGVGRKTKTGSQGIGNVVMAQGEQATRGLLEIPPSDGYLLVDIKKCQGCMTCMLACSLAHEGKENLSLSRIQVSENPFEKFPEDIMLDQCRQCLSPECVKACPTGALSADSRYGNVRTVNTEKCIGCQTCIGSCPYTPSRMMWNPEKNCAQKCDLCSDTPYWDEQGGPAGMQACVANCPLGAIQLTKTIPVQQGNVGYKVNLRAGDPAWARAPYPKD